MTRFYTGVGSRKTPADIQELMYGLAYLLANRGWTLRSGGAQGADTAFQKGANGIMEIYRPRGEHQLSHTISTYSDAQWNEAMSLASQVHPAWHRCPDYARALHARNAFQVFGANLDHPSEALVCWTPCGAQTEAECTRETGGTGTAIRLASRANIPVYNLRDPESFERLRVWKNSVS